MIFLQTNDTLFKNRHVHIFKRQSYFPHESWQGHEHKKSLECEKHQSLTHSKQAEKRPNLQYARTRGTRGDWISIGAKLWCLPPWSWVQLNRLFPSLNSCWETNGVRSLGSLVNQITSTESRNCIAYCGYQYGYPWCALVDIQNRNNFDLYIKICWRMLYSTVNFINTSVY